MSEHLIEMFKHNGWANQQLLDACQGLSDAQLDATVVGTFGSIRDTLIHIIGAQERYTTALVGADVGKIRERDPFPGFAELREAERLCSAALVELAARAKPGATATTVYRDEEFTLPVWLLLVQAINHATEHRAQVAAILTHQGIDPPSMDGWTYQETRDNADWSRLWSW
jgi:uncharacterized damage-inducible protein DinB